MSRWTFFGDAHGDFMSLNNMMVRAQHKFGASDYQVQVGDFGFYPETKNRPDPINEVTGERLFIRGNHEDHSSLPLDATEPVLVGYDQWKYVPDAWFHPDGVLFIGGAYSIDRAYRINGPYRFHYNEQLSVREEYEIFDKIRELKSKIKVIVTHDCPLSVYTTLFGDRLRKVGYENTQARFFTQVLEELSIPNCSDHRLTWIFGHHHQHVDQQVGDTRFVCLNMVDRFVAFIPNIGDVVVTNKLEACSIVLEL
jgi:hypothetical protein